uniref:Eukaryotic translation initiation factor 5 n=1 Tax=Meloidogyne enterolobii TaxID=390850 RepID=A0A6V7UP70_MELEN|nr:unnamed protein product [Meloidogyne enterolobii]
MAQKVNVNRNVQDPFYRYKMPRLLAKVEGKGNGIKTVVANMPEIAKALSRPPTYPTKYFGCELGAQTYFDFKNDRYIVNGEHDASKLQELLDGFIKKFVLCPACDNPETVLSKNKSFMPNVKLVDMDIKSIRNKNCLLIFLKILQRVKKAMETGKMLIIITTISGSPPTEAGEDGNLEEDNGTVNGAVRGGSGSLDEEDDDDWAPEVIEAEKLSGEMSKMVVDKDLDKSIDDRLDMLLAYFQQALNDGTIQDGKKMLNEAERLELKNKASLLLANVLFTEDLVQQIKQYRNLLLRFCMNDAKAQRHLLGGIEQKVLAKKDVLLPKTAHIIKALYDNDICDEEVLLSWGKKPSSKYVKKDFAKEMIKVAQPVLVWLEEAEEGSESDNNDEDIAVAFDDRSRVVGTVVENRKEETAKKGLDKEEEGEGDVDIDNI